MLLENWEIEINGKFIKTAQLKEEWDADVKNPSDIIEKLHKIKNKADIFTFMQRLPNSKPHFNYFMEWDNIAAIPVTTYENWLKNQITKNSRKKIGYAERKGIELRSCEFNDDFVRGILEIYHESPILQGKPNRQYRTDFETAKKINSTFLGRAQFFGAFLGDELIAYIKLVSTENFMRTMGIFLE